MAINYSPTRWINRLVKRPRTYTQTQNEDGSVTLVPAPGEVKEPGTPLNEENLNHIEQGIKACADGVNSMEQTVQELNAKVEEFSGSVAAHKHDAGDITSGVLGVPHGGTGKESVTAGSFLVGNGTGAMVEKTPAEVLADIGAAESGAGCPSVTTADNGKFLRVVNGAWAAVEITDASGVSF